MPVEKRIIKMRPKTYLLYDSHERTKMVYAPMRILVNELGNVVHFVNYLLVKPTT